MQVENLPVVANQETNASSVWARIPARETKVAIAYSDGTQERHCIPEMDAEKLKSLLTMNRPTLFHKFDVGYSCVITDDLGKKVRVDCMLTPETREIPVTGLIVVYTNAKKQGGAN